MCNCVSKIRYFMINNVVDCNHQLNNFVKVCDMAAPLRHVHWLRRSDLGQLTRSIYDKGFQWLYA